MPQFTGVTIFGTQIIADLEFSPIGQLQFAFVSPFIPALEFRRIGRLWIRTVPTAGRLIFQSYELTYPGIWPIINGAVEVEEAQIVIQCTRPGLSFVMDVDL